MRDSTCFCLVIMSAVCHIHSNQPHPTAVVSGQSIIGMLAAAVLAKSGYQVHCFESRSEYIRNIQWAVRQSVVDELASIDQTLADSFVQNVVKPIYKGSTHVYADGYRRNKSHDGLQRGDPSRLPSTCEEMMATSSVGIVEAKIFETFLKNYVLSLPNVYWHNNSCIASQQNADIVVIAEGFNSTSRDTLHIPLIPVAEKQLQIAGTLNIGSGGVMIKHWRNENGHIRLTGIMGRAESNSTWMIADVDPSRIVTQDEIDTEFRRLAGAALDLPEHVVANLQIEGSVDKRPVAPFFMRQAICETAIKGDNIILIGDAVGAGHWSVGGGMQTGSVCHMERLKTLLKSMRQGIPKVQALQKYSEAVIKDTTTWIEISAKDVPRIARSY